MAYQFKELDSVRIKSKNVYGVIVNITKAGTYDVEKWGNEGPVYWNILEEDMELVNLKNKSQAYISRLLTKEETNKEWFLSPATREEMEKLPIPKNVGDH